VLANSHLAQRQYEDALRYLEQALPLRRALWEGDQANTLTWHQLVFTLMRMGETHVLAGQPGKAGELLRESIRRIESRPGLKEHWVIPTLARAYLALGAVEAAARSSPCRSYRRSQELLRDLPDAEKYLSPDTAGLRDRARQRLKSCPGAA
jgi:tetratricopeptide (TPR) repeat protein